jgi:hypothetical protein
VHFAIIDSNDDGELDAIIAGQANDGTTHTIKLFDIGSPEVVDLIFDDDKEFAGGFYLGAAMGSIRT